MTVSVVRLQHPLESLRRAVMLCDGFAQLRENHRVLLKPNIPFCFNMPPYGMVTTTTILDGLSRLLIEHGCTDISIGEGTVELLGSNTLKGYKWTHIDRLARRYGLRLVDLNKGPFQKVDLGGIAVQVSTAAFETDFLINIPVLKTHSQTKVSLGFKNLKGFLSPSSKIKFHGTGRLNELICRLNEVIRVDLTVIDGTYVLEKGPDTVLGTAYRKDLILASRDAFACDVVGASIMGIDPSEVRSLREYAIAHGRSLDLEAIQVRGETNLAPFIETLDWKPDVASELLAPAGIGGLSVPYPGESLCSRCYVTLGLALLALIGDNPRTHFEDAMICCGKDVKAQPWAKRILLYGDCAIKNNSSISRASRVEGCPPTINRSLIALWETSLSKPRLLKTIPLRMLKQAGARAGLYSDKLPKWRKYKSGDFDRNHFSAA
jgi:uncharacterized protein (DUF362 family)